MSPYRPCILAAVAALLAAPAGAHYHILLPDRPSAKTDEAVTFTYQFGHPFEHQLFDTERPAELYAIFPDGTKSDLSAKMEKVSVDGADGKKVIGYKFSFTPQKRGDYTFVAVSSEVKVEGEPLPLRDAAKVVLHVQTQNGWDRKVLGPGTAAVELAPLSRPYGLTAGAAFQVEADEPADGDRKPIPGVAVEVERYNTTPPKELPPDEQITRTARTSRAGDAVVTLTEPGWWGVTAVRDRDKVRHRCTVWVSVDGKTPTAPAK